MIVFDLRCGGGHVFEAWFASGAAFEAQAAAGQVRCPLCDDTAIGKAVMAPAVAAKGNRAVACSVPDRDQPGPGQVKQALAALAAAQAKMLETSQWVGRGFSGRARAMHLGEEPHAPIHGQATAAEARSLIDEGVAVAPLPLPVVPPGTSN